MTHRIGSKGQVVIPKELRERAGLHPGAEVDFELHGDEVTVKKHLSDRPLGGRFTHSGLTRGLEEDRAREPR